MTQFKDKAGSQRDLVSAGLFFYPVLQAADVLAYRAERGPRRGGSAPARRADARRRRALQRPLRRDAGGARASASPRSARGSWTSRPPTARCRPPAAPRRAPCYVLDEPEAIVKKFRSAVTDSGTEVVRGARQGRHLEPDRDPRRGPRGPPPTRSSGRSTASGYGAFKQAVADAVVEYLAPVRERYQELRADEAALERILADGAEKARAIAAGHAARRPSGDGRRTGPAADR